MTVSLWQDTAAWPGEVDHEFVEADVCVIGGGFVGGTLATLLGELGKQVVVVEAQQVGLGTSGRNAGHCIAAFRDNYHRVIERLGHDAAGELREQAIASRQWVTGLCQGLKVPHEANGSRYLAIDERERERLLASFEALKADGQDVEWHDEDPWDRGFHGMIYQPGDLGLQPYLLTSRLMAASGARVIENSPAREIVNANGKVEVHTRLATVRCEQAILATNAFSRLVHPFFRGRVDPIRAQALATEPLGFRMFDGPTGTNDGFEYFRQLPDTRFIIGGYRDVYADEEVGYADETTPHLQAGLERWAGEHFPELNDLRVTHRWAGIMGFTPDGLPLVGRLPDLDEVYYCVGFNGGGMSMGPVAARRAVALMTEGASPGVFDGDRLA
ncbi:MAG TPA: FAD-binding oxidoreductase [Thermomicrobiales bacterium]|nr:FAD-binding oxidoreductase [Thermomicrobiales bacterium]